MTTDIHGYLLWIPGTTAADTAFNALAEQLDVEVSLRALSRTTDAEPGSPSEGDIYIMTASATGTDWATYDEGDIAYYRDAAWTSYAPKGAQIAFVDDTEELACWDGTDWITVVYDNKKYPGSNFQTGTSYTLVLADAGKIVDMSNAAANTLNIPDNSSVAFPVNTRIDIIQSAAGVTSVAMPGSDTLRGELDLAGQWKAASLWKRASTEWVVIGTVTL